MNIETLMNTILGNWMLALAIIVVVAIQCLKVKKLAADPKTAQLATVKKQIAQVVLALVAEAERDYSGIVGAGAIKRSQVLEKLFETYPILSVAVDQRELLEWIDDAIDASLRQLREVLEANGMDS